MRKLAIILLMILPLTIWANEDREFTFVYGNVTVRFKTWSYYEEINNVKIIGKYAALLSDSLNYDKPIFLDFIVEYGFTYHEKARSFLNFGSDEYLLVSHLKKTYDFSGVENGIETVPISKFKANSNKYFKDTVTIAAIDKNDKIVLRQFGFHFDIKETINLIHFAILNDTKIKYRSKQDTLSNFVEGEYYTFESLPRSYIDSVKLSSYHIVENVLQHRIYKELEKIHNGPHFTYTGDLIFIDSSAYFSSFFSQNGKIIVYVSIDDKEIILDTLNQIYATTILFDSGVNLFVFETPNTMRIYDEFNYSNNEFYRSKIQTIPIENNGTLFTIEVKEMDNDLYFIHYLNFDSYKQFLYLKEDDLIIDNFDAYINSFRKTK